MEWRILGRRIITVLREITYLVVACDARRFVLVVDQRLRTPIAITRERRTVASVALYLVVWPATRKSYILRIPTFSFRLHCYNVHYVPMFVSPK
jgi:hypothetical protein